MSNTYMCIVYVLGMFTGHNCDVSKQFRNQKCVNSEVSKPIIKPGDNVSKPIIKPVENIL